MLYYTATNGRTVADHGLGDHIPASRGRAAQVQAQPAPQPQAPWHPAAPVQRRLFSPTSGLGGLGGAAGVAAKMERARQGMRWEACAGSCKTALGMPATGKTPMSPEVFEQYRGCLCGKCSADMPPQVASSTCGGQR